MLSTAVSAAPPVDSTTLARISNEGFNHGEVAETAAYLADRIGGRMHSIVDTFDHLRPQDMRQASVIRATMLLDAADAQQPLPRNALPSRPVETNPFRYDDPDDF